MAVFGIIAEYNPFHNGHRRQLEMIRALDPGACVVAVMSGGFTQRGEAAVLDKWTRARLAVENGLDLVLELPFAFAGRSAQFFASGGVRLLDRLGVVEKLAFGSELSNLDALRSMVERSLSPAAEEERRRGMKEGRSYASAMAEAVAGAEDEAWFLRQPNTILAIEYLKALQVCGADIHPVVLPREKAAYHEMTLRGMIASAAAIRAELKKDNPNWERIQKAVSDNTLSSLRQQKKAGLPDLEFLSRAVLASFLRNGASSLRRQYGMSEGLEHRFLAAAENSGSLRELLENVRCKRYPASRVRRTILYLLLGLSRETIQQFDDAGPLYARVLAFNDQGRALLKEIQNKGSIPLVTRIRDCLPARCFREGRFNQLQEMLALDIRVTKLWNLSLPVPVGRVEDYTMSPVYLPGGKRIPSS